jgi:hypothetical protein
VNEFAMPSPPGLPNCRNWRKSDPSGRRVLQTNATCTSADYFHSQIPTFHGLDKGFTDSFIAGFRTIVALFSGWREPGS